MLFLFNNIKSIVKYRWAVVVCVDKKIYSSNTILSSMIYRYYKTNLFPESQKLCTFVFFPFGGSQHLVKPQDALPISSSTITRRDKESLQPAASVNQRLVHFPINETTDQSLSKLSENSPVLEVSL